VASDAERTQANFSTRRAATARRAGLTALAPMLFLVLIVGGLLIAQGGYFPTSWGWPSLALLWGLGLWLVLDGRTELDRADAAFLALVCAFAVWVGMSIAWSASEAQSVLELERTILVLAGVGAFVAFGRRDLVDRIGVAVLTMITLVCTYSLGTRLFPDRLGVFDPIAVYRLAEPIGYWNGLGIVAVMGILIALAIAATKSGPAARAGAAVALVLLPTTLYFTYSRASWLVLGLGLAVAVAVADRRLVLVAAALAALPVPAACILLASRPDALTERGANLEAAADEGRRLALILVVLVALQIGVVLALDAASRRIRVEPGTRRAIGAALLAALVVAVAGVVIRFGGPADLVRSAYDSFIEPPVGQSDLDKRLFSFSGNGRADLWRYAWSSYRDHQVLGSGAGTFERVWQANDDAAFKVRDAHGLYVETLSELGPIGLALLVGVLSIPLYAGIAARRRPRVPLYLGAYIAFVVHAGVDWDWELGGVTLAALLVGSMLLAARHREEARTLGDGWRIAGVASALLVSGFALVALIGNNALARSVDARAASRFGEAVREADRAHRLMPWSPRPWIARGEAELDLGDVAAARASFRRAIGVDAREWEAWLDLAVASAGQERSRALARARALYPRSIEIAETAAELAESSG
jgi:tetratricopeptide (TPR) repeat protein